MFTDSVVEGSTETSKLGLKPNVKVKEFATEISKTRYTHLKDRMKEAPAKDEQGLLT